MLTPEQAVLASILACMAGAALTLAGGAQQSRWRDGWHSSLRAGPRVLILVSRLSGADAVAPRLIRRRFWAMPQFGFALRIYVDGLTAVFLLLADTDCRSGVLLLHPYMRHYRDYGVARYYPYFLLFLAAMYGLLEHDGHDVVLLHLLAADDAAGVRAHPIRAPEAGERAGSEQVPGSSCRSPAPRPWSAPGRPGLRRRRGDPGAASLKYEFPDGQREPAPHASPRGPAPTTVAFTPVPRRLRDQDGHVAVRTGVASRRPSGRALARERHALRGS